MVYTADNLWEVINGAAELYLAYDFQDLHQAIYSADNEREVRVELYRHSYPGEHLWHLFGRKDAGLHLSLK